MRTSKMLRDCDLHVWQKAMVLVEQVYALTVDFPPRERFGLTAQIRRAAVSVPSNISEGHARGGREFRQFLNIAAGSLAELRTQLQVSLRLGYTTAEDAQPVLATIDHGIRLVVRLRQAIVC